jgi:hypothetical protein
VHLLSIHTMSAPRSLTTYQAQPLTCEQQCLGQLWAVLQAGQQLVVKVQEAHLQAHVLIGVAGQGLCVCVGGGGGELSHASVWCVCRECANAAV